MGGMAAFIPSRTDAEANRKARRSCAADKEREAGDGFDGTWVAHPDSVAGRDGGVRRGARRAAEPGRSPPRRRVGVGGRAARRRRDARRDHGDGLRNNVNVGIQYISSWLRGNGAAAIYGLMEDAATAEISRSQVWQWIRHGAELDDGRTVTPELVREIEAEELEKIREEIGDDEWFEREGRPRESRELFEQVALADEFVEFLTLPAYDYLVGTIERT